VVKAISGKRRRSCGVIDNDRQIPQQLTLLAGRRRRLLFCEFWLGANDGAVGGAGGSHGVDVRNTPIAESAALPCFSPENRDIFQEKQGGD